MTSKRLRDLIAETYTEHESKYFGYADRGNGSGFDPGGEIMTYDDDAAERYGDVILTACKTIRGADQMTEYTHASAWQQGANGYQFRILF